MKIKNTFYILATLLSFAIFHSCKPELNNCDNCETELITTIQVTLTDSATGYLTHYRFRDLDGDGANPPVQFDTIRLIQGHTYSASLLILDESKTPADTTSQQIATEANDHQFFYHAETIGANFVYEDHDMHVPPMPLGLFTKWYIGSTTGPGKIHIMLKHQPGIKDGNESTGEVDLDVNFNAIVE